MDDIDLISTTPICKGHQGRPCIFDCESGR
jgi:hypothetical protein